MGDPSEVIDLTDSFCLVNHCNLISDGIIEIDESDSSFVNDDRTKLAQKRKTSDKNQVPVKNKRCTMNETSEYSATIGECPICFDQLGKRPMASTKCGHVFCLRCIRKSLKHKKKCPQCREVLGASAFHPLYVPLK